MKVIVDITKCKDCIFVSNSSKEHDDAFTSEPLPIRWYCRHKKKKGSVLLYDVHTIDINCPIRE